VLIVRLATAGWFCCSAAVACGSTVASAVATQSAEPISEATVEQPIAGSPAVASTCTRIADVDWNFFADNLSDASGVGVWLANLDTLGNLDGLAVVDWLADGVAYLLGAALLHDLAGRVGVRAALLFADPVANRVANILDSLLANHLAGLVANGLLTALRNQLAGRVGADLALLFADPVAYRVGNFLGSALRNELAGGVGDRLLTAFRNQLAYVVRNRLAAALGHALGDGVRANLGQAFGFVLDAVDGLFFASWNPNSLADLLRRALDAFNSAGTWAVYIAAGCWVEGPSAWLSHDSANNRTGNFFFRRLPATTANHDGLGVVNRLGDSVVDSSLAGFGHWHHDGVVDHAFAGFHHSVHHRVVDNLFVGFTNWGHYRVVDGLGPGLTNWGANGVVHNLFMGFTDGDHHRVVDNLFMGFVDRLHDVVRHLLGTGFMNRSANGVVPNSFMLLIHRYVDRVLNIVLVRFSLVADALHLFVFVYDFVYQPVTGNGFWFVNNFAYRLHYGVRRRTTRIHDVTAAVLVADRTAKCGLNSSSAVCGHEDRKSWQSQKLSHCSILPRTYAVPRRTLVSNEATFCCSSLRCRLFGLSPDHVKSLDGIVGRQQIAQVNLVPGRPRFSDVATSSVAADEQQRHSREGRLVPSNCFEGVLDETRATA